MKNSFCLRAPTVKGGWCEFEIKDCPVKLTDETFLLVNKPGSPVMYADIYRGDWETGLYEGDLIFFDGCTWLVNYDRGFYAINEAREKKFLYQLPEWKYIGVSGIDVDFPVKFSRRKKHALCCSDLIFSIWNFQNATDTGFRIMRYASIVPFDEVHQECCVKINGRRAFLGNRYDNHIIQLYGGRLGYKDGNKYYDVTTGGELVGYIPKPDRRN